MAKQQNERALGKYVTLMPPCFYCKHLISIGEQFSEVRWTCKAFPDGIPYDIWSRSSKHTEPRPKPLQVGKYVFVSKVYEHGEGPEVITFEGTWQKKK